MVALCIGLLIFRLSLGAAVGIDLLGFGVTTAVWTDVGKAFAAVSRNYAGLGGLGSLLATYVFVLVVMTIAARAMGLAASRFAATFSIIFWASIAAYLIGNVAYIAATPNQLGTFQIPWSLGLTGEAGYVLALVAGLVVGNFFPRAAEFLRAGARPEWFIKIGIIVLGAFLGVQAAGATNIASAILFRGFAAIIEAYLIYWVLQHRIGVELPPAVAGGIWQAGRGVRAVAVWVRHLGRARHLVCVLPRDDATNPVGEWCDERN